MNTDSAETAHLIGQAQGGDPAALNALFTRHRDRLRRMVDMRLDRRLQGRVDASDVIQEAYVDAARKLDDYLRGPKLPLFLPPRLAARDPPPQLHPPPPRAQMPRPGRAGSLYRPAPPPPPPAA